MAEENDDKTEAPHPTDLKKPVRMGRSPIPRADIPADPGGGRLHNLVGREMLARRLAGMLSAGLRFDHSMVNDPNLILIQIINLVKSAMIALLPLIAGVVIVALVSPVMLGGGVQR